MRVNKKGGRLSADMISLIGRMVVPLGVEAETLMCQARRAKVLLFTPTMIDVDVVRGAPEVDLPDGPAPGRVFVLDDEGGTVGEILIWVESGRLIGLEQAWYTERAPSSWPDLSHIRVS